MKLTHIKLEDFRCFGVADFDLTDPTHGGPLDVVLLVGANGSGKSAVLDAVAGFFTHQYSSYSGKDGYDGKELTPLDVRQGAPRSRIDVSWRDQVDAEGMALFDGTTIIDQLGGVSSATRDKKALYKWFLQTKKAHSSAGLIVGFDVYRLVPSGVVVGPTNQDAITAHCKLALAPTLDGEGHVRPRAHHLKQWIVNLDARRARAKADRGEDLPLWHTLRHALNTLLSPYTFEGVDDSFQVVFQTPTGRVPIEALSDGFRSVFVVVAELLLRSSLATADPDAVLEQEAVCLIDEIDAHLHPRWQDNVIPGLRALFPKVQWIATTHSENVVAAVEPKNVFRLEDMQAISAARQDKRFHLPERTVVSIDEEVFGARPGSGGRRWVLDPPVEVRRRFWDTFGAEIEPHQRVFVAEGPVLLEQIRDAHERPLPGVAGRTGEVALFFVDREPEASWSHPCAYILLPASGGPLRVEHGWPPSEATRLLPLPRPPGS